MTSDELAKARERFDAYVWKDENSCWLWQGKLYGDGRGRFSMFGRSMTAPRAALEFKLGRPVKPKMRALHGPCDNARCVNPGHLYEGTPQQNVDDMIARGRYAVHRSGRKDGKPPLRPVVNSFASPGIDHRTHTERSTPEERRLAQVALRTLEEHHNVISLAPAPQPAHRGHLVRVWESANPEWYREFGKSFWDGPRQFNLKRIRIERALQRVIAGRVRGNGYERRILDFLERHEALLQEHVS